MHAQNGIACCLCACTQKCMHAPRKCPWSRPLTLTQKHSKMLNALCSYLDSTKQQQFSLLVTGVNSYEKAPQQQQWAARDERTVSAHRKNEQPAGKEATQTRRRLSSETLPRIDQQIRPAIISAWKRCTVSSTWLAYVSPIATIPMQRRED